MNVLTARAQGIYNKKFIYGFPVYNAVISSTFIYYMYQDKDGIETLIRAEVDPATLSYETGKRDCRGDMIYGGMEIKAFNSISSVEQDEDGIWKLFRASPALKILRGCEYLLRCESSDLEIIKDGE